MKIRNKLNLVFIASGLLLVIFGISYVRFVQKSAISNVSNEALKLAAMSADGLNGEMLKQLQAVNSEVGTVAYESVKKRLMRIPEIDKNIRFAYIYTKKNDKVYFIADSEPVSSSDYSPPGQEFTEADTQISRPFFDSQPLVTNPTTDRWGTWVSVLVPMKNPETGQIVNVFGADYPARYWNDRIFYEVMQASIGVFSLFLLLFIFYFLIKNNYKFKESEKKFRAFTDSAKDAVVVMDSNGLVILWNRAAELMFGYQESEILGKEFHKYITVKKAHQDKTNILQFGQTGESKVLGKLIEMPVKDKAGREFIIELSVSKTLVNNEWNAIGIMRDVTSRKQEEELVKKSAEEIRLKSLKAEEQQKAILNILEDIAEEKNRTELLAKDLEKFKLAVENASDHIVITDANGIILYANKGVERITGFKVNEVLGKKSGSKDTWGGLMSPEIYQDMWDTIKNKKKVYSGQIKNHRKNGEEYEVMTNISPILDSGGQVIFFVGIERDVTKEKMIDKAKTEFVSLASHQLRTPLSAINWYAEMLLAGDAGKLNNEQKEHIEEIYKGNQRMVELVNALLNVSRLELGTFVVEPKITDLKLLSLDVVKEQAIAIKNKKLSFKVEYAKDLPQLNVDPKLIRMVFQNLLSNAIKYTPEKGRISLTMNWNKKGVLLSVKDSGYGIPKGQQDKIFQKLFRADNVKAMDTEGTGLGLYIIKGIVDQSSGKIWFESQEGKGSEFFVLLPLAGMTAKTGTRELN